LDDDAYLPIPSPLVDSGFNVPVTRANVGEQINGLLNNGGLFAHGNVQGEMAAITRGFQSVLPPATFIGFKQEDLYRFVNGLKIDIRELVDRFVVSVDDLNAAFPQHTVLSDLHDGNDGNRIRNRRDQIEAFKQIILGLSAEDQVNFLQFATGAVQIPASGTPAIHIDGVALDPSGLPRSHTCGLTVHLPPYPTVERMRRKLLESLANNSGGLHDAPVGLD